MGRQQFLADPRDQLARLGGRNVAPSFTRRLEVPVKPLQDSVLEISARARVGLELLAFFPAQAARDEKFERARGEVLQRTYGGAQFSSVELFRKRCGEARRGARRSQQTLSLQRRAE